jgi:hypothetical protein
VRASRKSQPLCKKISVDQRSKKSVPQAFATFVSLCKNFPFPVFRAFSGPFQLSNFPISAFPLPKPGLPAIVLPTNAGPQFPIPSPFRSCHLPRVRTRKKLIALALGLAAVGVFVALALRAREPRFQGHPLSYWLVANNGYRETAQGKQAQNAIATIGTNAIPFLLRWMDCEPSTFRAKAESLAQLLPSGLRPKPRDPPYMLARRSAFAFEFLGNAASNAVPALMLLATNSTTTEGIECSITALAVVGPPALSALLTLSTNSQLTSRRLAISAMASLGHEARPAIPTITQCLNDADSEVAWRAAMALGRIGLSPETCVPALTNLLTSAEPKCRMFAALALRQFGPRYLNDADKKVVATTTLALGRLRPSPELCVPALTNIFTNVEPQNRLYAAFTLPYFGEAARVAVPQLQKLLLDPDPNVSAESRKALQQIAPEVLTNAPAGSQ